MFVSGSGRHAAPAGAFQGWSCNLQGVNGAVRKFLPSFSDWTSNIKGDIFGGITASVVALPLALAFGVLSGAGAVAGLYGAIFTGIIASIFGGCRAQVTGPTGGMTVVLVLVYKQIGLEGLFLAMFLAGLIEMGLSFLRVGKHIHFIPHPVITGFSNGIAILIFLQQLDALRGSDGLPNWPAVAVAASVVGIMFIWPRITGAVPGSLVALLVTTAAATLFLKGSVPLIGEIPSGMPQLNLGFLTELGSLHQVLWPAVMIALLGVIESLLSSMVVDEMAGQRHDPDKEMFGQGLGTLVASLFGGIAGTGAIVRSAVNVRAGGRTPLSGVIHGLILLLVTLALGKYAAMIPMATLAGILMMTAYGMVDRESIKDLRRAPLSDSIVMIATAATTVLADLVTAVAVGVALSMILFTLKMAQTPVQVRRADGVHLVAPNGPLFFGVAKRFLNEVEAAGAAGVMIWDLSQVTSVDATGAVMLRKAHRAAREKGIEIRLVGLQHDVQQVLERSGVLAEIGRDKLRASLQEAIPVGAM